MKSYYIDEISKPDIDKITSYLNKNALSSGMDKLFWIEIPENSLTALQNEHTGCSPFRFAIETGDSWIRAEFFIRTSKKFRCDCNAYCNETQLKYITDFIDSMISRLDIRT